MTPLRAARAWLDAPVPWTERSDYRLGQGEGEAAWRRASRLDTLRRSAARRVPSPEKWLYRAGLRRADALALPDLLCLGAQKAATSWLHAHLARHPGAFVPDGAKEVHYFDLLFREPLAAYAALFETGRDRVKCDVTPAYGGLRPSRIRFVRRVMPAVRLVFLMRDPVERAWSHAVMDLATRADREVGEVRREEWLAHFRSRASRRGGAYTAMLDAWARHFPPEHLLVAFYEDVCERPAELLGRVFDHAGLDRDAATHDVERPVAPGPGVPLPDDLRAALARLYAEEIRRVAARFGGAATRWGRGPT